MRNKGKSKKMEKNSLIGAAWCAPCGRVKRFLDNRGVGYRYVDIDTEEGLELARELGVRSVPAMVVDGNVIVGEPNIMEAFGE